MSHSSCHLAFVGAGAAQSLTLSRSYYACWLHWWYFLAYLDYLLFPGGFASDAIDLNATVDPPGLQGDTAFRNYWRALARSGWQHRLLPIVEYCFWCSW